MTIIDMKVVYINDKIHVSKNLLMMLHKLQLREKINKQGINTLKI